MQFFIISAILASAVAAPAYLLSDDHQVYHSIPASITTYSQSSQDYGSTLIHKPLVKDVIPVTHIKTTVTKSNQLVHHGGSALLHPVHPYEAIPIHEVYHVPSKTTVTKNSQLINHGDTTLIHSPATVHASVVHAPVVHAPLVYHSSPVITVKAGDSAITHHSSTVHETIPQVKSLPVFAVHH